MGGLICLIPVCVNADNATIYCRDSSGIVHVVTCCQVTYPDDSAGYFFTNGQNCPPTNLSGQVIRTDATGGTCLVHDVLDLMPEGCQSIFSWSTEPITSSKLDLKKLTPKHPQHARSHPAAPKSHAYQRAPNTRQPSHS